MRRDAPSSFRVDYSSMPKTKAALYASLGVSLCYEHDRHVVTVEARQPGHVQTKRCRRAEDSDAHWRLRPWSGAA